MELVNNFLLKEAEIQYQGKPTLAGYKKEIKSNPTNLLHQFLKQ